VAAPNVPALRVPITRPQLGKPEADAAARVVRSGWVIQGPEVAAFESELAALPESQRAAYSLVKRRGLSLAAAAQALAKWGAKNPTVVILCEVTRGGFVQRDQKRSPHVSVSTCWRR